MVTEVAVPDPTIPDLISLAESTSNIFDLLRPWCTGEFNLKSKALMSLRNQTLSYAKAVNYSIEAAHHGYTIANEALGLAEKLQTSSNTSEESCQQYLVGMVQIAQLGEANAKRALETFRDVRETLEKLIRDVAKEIASDKNNIFLRLRKSLDVLESGMPVLESFRDAISNYVSWWNTLSMTHIALSRGIKFNYNSFRQKAVLVKWKALKETYVDYTFKIKDIQDSNTDFILELKMLNDKEKPGDSLFTAARTFIKHCMRGKDRIALS